MQASPRLMIVLKIGVSAALLALILWSMDLAAFLEGLAGADPLRVLVAFLLALAIRCLMALRWQMLLRHDGVNVPFSSTLRITFTSFAVGNVLPAGIGTDVVRSVQLGRQAKAMGKVARSVFLDRLIGVFSMFLVAFAGSWLVDLGTWTEPLRLGLGGVLVLCLAGWIAVWFLRARLLGLAELGGMAGKIGRFAGALAMSLTNRAMLVEIAPRLLGVSLVIQATRCLMFYLLFQALGATVPLLAAFVFVPITFVVVTLPVSLGGLGVREGALVLLFASVGVAPEISTGVGLMAHAIQALVAVPGVLWLLGRSPKSQPPGASAETAR